MAFSSKWVQVSFAGIFAILLAILVTCATFHFWSSPCLPEEQAPVLNQTPRAGIHFAGYQQVHVQVDQFRPASPFSAEQLEILNKIKEQAKEAGLQKSEVDQIDKFAEDVCYEFECLESALEILGAANFSVDACEPGKWIEFVCQRRILGESKWSKMSDRQLQTDLQTQILLLKDDTPINQFLLPEAKAFFKQCFRRGLTDKTNVLDILQYARKSGGWPLLTYEMPESNFSWWDMVADQNRFEAPGFTPSFLSVSLQTYHLPWKPWKPEIRLTVDSRNFLRKYETDDWKNMLTNMVTAGELEDPADIEQLNAAIDSMDTLYDEIPPSWNYSKLELTLQQLQQQSDEYFSDNGMMKMKGMDWSQFFGRVFTGADINLEDPELRISLPFETVMGLIKTVEHWMAEEEGERQNILNALQLNVASMLLHETTSLGNYKGVKGHSGLASCTEKTTKIFGYSLGKTYLSLHYNQSSDSKIHSLMDSIKLGFSQLVGSWSWMPNSTEEFLVDKVSDIQLQLPRPHWMEDPSSVEDYYKGLQADPRENSSAVFNFLQVNSWWVAKERGWNYAKMKARFSDEFKEQRSRFDSRWNGYLGVTYAAFQGSANTVYVDAGYLQYPIFHWNLPGFMTYGGLGTIFGHEVGHGMINGVNAYRLEYPSEANSSLEGYDQWVNGIAQLYESTPFVITKRLSKRLNPLGKTIEEDVADILGLNAAYLGYQGYLKELEKEGKKEKILPGLKSVSHQKLFFMKYSNLWCENLDPQSKLNEVFSGDSHSPQIRRADLPVRLSDHFKTSFNCN